MKDRPEQLPGYAWKVYKKGSSSTVNDSASENNKALISNQEGSEEKIGSAVSSHIEPKDNFSEENKEEDLIRDFQNKPWMQDPKSSKTRPKALPDKKLAIRSDVVNKTLLRSLKRYYTAEFERQTQSKISTKSTQKEEVYQKIRDFTESIYQDEPRFGLSEFNDVTMDDLFFYMGICINPQMMKKTTSTPQERSRFQNFYSCLYKYSHKKLMKLFSSKALYFMFRKFFEDGVFEDLLVNDSTLKRNPEVYKTASENFINLFNQH